VIAREQRSPPERAWGARINAREPDGVELALSLSGGRRARLRVGVPTEDRVELELDADGTPLRLAIEWEQRAEERFVGLGARHNTRLDQAGRMVQLGADRRYTGPDCPPELLEQGGIPQGDCAPVPWLVSSRGYAVWVRTDANGTQFDLGGELVTVSTRAGAGPLRMDLLCATTPAARLRAFCRLTGFAAVLPEWGYGFWKSRDFHEHRDDVLEDLEGFRRHRIPLDAIVIDSPWETQYNTWEFNPHQFPDASDMVAKLRAEGVRTVLWITPWVNVDSRDGQIPPQPESQHLHERPAANYAPAAAAGHFVRAPGGEPFLTRWWMGDGLHEPGRRAVVASQRPAGARARRRGDQGRRRRGLLHPR
jgi:alpha-glucosidase (family GH31 glycosyl hydrolase)